MANSSFEERRKHLADLTDEELKARFWELGEKIVEPLLELGKVNTSPSIERSVLLRMGFSSIEANKIVNEVIARNLMGKGAGHVVYRLSRSKGITVREAGILLAQGDSWDDVTRLFAGGGQ